MAGNSNKNQLYSSTAPTAPEDLDRASLPPSYEECLTMNYAIGGLPHQYTYANHTSPNHVGSSLSVPYGYANPYQVHIHQQQHFYNTLSSTPQSGVPKPVENILCLAKGAKIRTTATGAISIPPPPPGCAPTPGQMAAMSGQPVMVKKQKRSFF